MKKFSRYILCLILVTVLTGAIGYAVLNSKITNMYTSSTQLYVVPGEKAEASIRSADGSLNDDFKMLIISHFVIAEAQKNAGTSEDMAKYITVNSLADSNIIEIVCTNPDQNTAKTYVDAVAKSALKITSVIPIEKISVLTEGTLTGESVKPHLYEYTAYITALGFVVCLVLELLFLLFISAFKRKEEDDEEDYNRFFEDRFAPKQESAVIPFVNTSHSINNKEEYDHTMVQQKHPIAPDILEDEEDDDGFEPDFLQDDNEEDLIVEVHENTVKTVAEVEVAVTQEQSSAEVLGRIPG